MGLTSDLFPFTLGGKSKAARILLSTPDLSDSPGSLCSSIVFAVRKQRVLLLPCAGMQISVGITDNRGCLIFCPLWQFYYK